MMDTQPAHTPATSRPLRLVVIVASLALGVWLLSPVFTSTYIEVFMERLHSMALLDGQGQLALDNQAYPLVTELLYATRVGMVELIRMGMIVFGPASIWSVRIVTLLSLAVLGAACVLFGRRWSREPVWALLAIFILTPGIVEPGFFFADNLPSAAFAMLALALVSMGRSALRWSAIGALFACAVLVRLDAVLVAPMILALLWLAVRQLRKMIGPLLIALTAAGALFAVNAWLTGITLLQSLRIGRLFSAVNAAPLFNAGRHRTVDITVGFFGLITLVCLAVGLWSNCKRQSRAWVVILALLPALFYLTLIPRANEIRDFCLLASPFVVLHGATGLRRLLEAARSSSGVSRWPARAAWLFFFAVLVSPAYLITKDGPRALVGRLWAPLFWRQWQGTIASALEQTNTLIQQIPPGARVLAISSFFEPDGILQLKLLENGYQIQPASTEGNCQSIATFRKGDTTVTEIRTEDPYGLLGGGYNEFQIAAIQLDESLQCLRGQRFDQSYFLSWGDQGVQLWPGQTGPSMVIAPPFGRGRLLRGAGFPLLGIEPLAPADLDKLQRAAAELRRHPPEPDRPLPGYAQIRQAVRNRFWTPMSKHF